jgi:hypothetical protein
MASKRCKNLPNEMDRVIYGMDFLACRFTPKKLILYFTTSECFFNYSVIYSQRFTTQKMYHPNFKRKEKKPITLSGTKTKGWGKKNIQLK